MVFLVFMTICIGALFFMPDLRDNYLSNYVVVWSPPTLSTATNLEHQQVAKEVPEQLPAPSEAAGKTVNFIFMQNILSRGHRQKVVVKVNKLEPGVSLCPNPFKFAPLHV